MPLLIDPPPPFAPKEQWRQFVEYLKTLPQDDPNVQAEMKQAEIILARAAD